MGGIREKIIHSPDLSDSARSSSIKILLLDDGRAGHLHQSEALAESLAESLIRAQIKTSTNNSTSAVELARIPLTDAGVLTRLESMTVLIGCGRRAAECSRSMKKRFGSKINSIQILNPVVAAASMHEHYWDWLLVPRHDQLRGPNIINFVGSLVKTPPPPTPGTARLLLLLGGATAYLRWDESSLNVWLDEAGTQELPVVVCPSRRTPPAILDLLRRCSEQNAGWQYVENNDLVAYRQALAQAAEFWVSGDSINMLAEACASERPVRALGAQLARGKVKRYIRELDDLGRFDGIVPIREADRVADELVKRGAMLGFNN